MNGREPLRGPHSNLAPPKDRRPIGDVRNGSGVAPAAAGMSRAEKFEDEKRRVMQSCFEKQDLDGSALESYITHIRVTEDAVYPSTPPPPTSPPENKKPRLIIVAVRKSGRVRMHKARENGDGSFSIGKTWVMDDLSRIQVYHASNVSTLADQQHKEWASNIGFTVTIKKPYHWQATTAKERDFFIGSLVKIYKKYTGGQVPELVGFEPHERDHLLGTGQATPQNFQQARSQANAQSRQEGTVPRARSPSGQPIRSPSPYTNRTPSREGAREPRSQPPSEQFLRKQPSHEQTQRPRPQFILPQLFQATSLRDQPPSTTDNSNIPREFGLPASVKPDPTSRRRPGGSSTDSLSHQVGNRPSKSQLNDNNVFSQGGGSLLNANTPSDYVKSQSSPDPALLSTPDLLKQKNLLSDTAKESKSGLQHAVVGTPKANLGQSETEEEFVTPMTSPEFKAREARVPSRGSDKSARRSDLGMSQREIPLSLRPGSGEFGGGSSQNAAVPADLQSQTAAASKIVDASPPPSEAPPPARPATPGGTPEVVTREEEVHRPGLGPMVKKKSAKDLASTLRKAATAYTAFKPRAGGAAERLMAGKEKTGNEPDGITGVVPAPLRGTNSEPAKQSTPDALVKEASSAASVQQLPKPQITGIIAEVEQSNNKPCETEAVPDESPQKSPLFQGERRRQRREDNTASYYNALGIDPSLLEGRGTYFDDIVTDLGWDGKLNGNKKINDLEADVRREIGRVQASSWLGHIEQQEGKVDQLAKLFDKILDECDELDGLLTLYSHELNTLADDVAYIEAQSQGLQVQAANQKLLQNELQNLLKTISISSVDLRSLREASLSNPEGIRETESSLSILYKAMVAIDSDIHKNKKRLADTARDRGINVYPDAEIGQMRAVKEKKVEYRNEAQLFLQRLKQYMGVAFKMAEQKTLDSVTKSRDENAQIESKKLDPSRREQGRQELWRYHAMMLFAREISSAEWTGIITLYEQQFKQSYQTEFRENTMAWKRNARKPTGDEQELLFTHQEKDKEGDGITTAARKLTVRRGKTVRVPGSLRLSFGEKNDGKIEPFEAYAGSLGEMTKLVSEEQNFVAQFFHIDSSNIDFSDVVAAISPEDRKRPKLSNTQSYDPDRDMAKKVEQVMGGIFSSWPLELQNLADWAIKSAPLQGVGVLHAMERKLSFFEETNQEFIVRILQGVHSRLVELFNRFIEDQIRGIEETKVKIKKRKGVISFMKVFPIFSATIENMLAGPSHEVLDVRFSVNDAYTKINRAMWESLKFIAKEAPNQQAGPSGSTGDPEDKEALNYHILLIENMNHYIEEVDCRENIVLEEWQGRATHDMLEHSKLYIDAVIRRPLGKLLDFVESTESLLQTVSPATDITLRPSHSRSVAKKLLMSYDLKELRRGIDLLKKRIEKHFGDADDPGLSRSLVVKMLKECESRYADVHDRTKLIIDMVYEGQMELEWRREEAASMFRR